MEDLKDKNEGINDDEGIENALKNKDEEKPKKLAGEFEKPEDLEKAYLELKKKMEETSKLKDEGKKEMPERKPEEKPEEDYQKFLERLQEQFWQDPITTVSQLIQAHLYPVLQKTSEVMLNSVKSKYSDFSKYENQINEALQVVAPEYRTPEVVERIYKMVKGADLLSKIEKQPPPVEPPSNQPPKSQPPQLTDEERRLAQEFGMTEEEWVKYREGGM